MTSKSSIISTISMAAVSFIFVIVFGMSPLNDVVIFAGILTCSITNYAHGLDEGVKLAKKLHDGTGK